MIGRCYRHSWPNWCLSVSQMTTDMFVYGNHNPVFFLFMIFHRCVTRVTRLVAHVEQELLTVPEYLEVIHVLELGSCISKTHNIMA